MLFGLLEYSVAFSFYGGQIPLTLSKSQLDMDL